MFNEKLKDAMACLSISQTELSQSTGIGKSSISQYLSGKNTPSEKRQREIAEALGMEDYFFEEVESPPRKQAERIPKLLPAEVARIMGLSEKTIVAGLRDGVFPWGYAIKGTGDKWVYFINARRFAEIERIEIE